MDINDKQVADRIRQLRKERKLTQQELADAMGCSRSVISTLESGRQVRGIKRYVQLADCFQMTVSDLLGLDYDRKLEYKLKKLEKCNG